MTVRTESSEHLCLIPGHWPSCCFGWISTGLLGLWFFNKTLCPGLTTDSFHLVTAKLFGYLDLKFPLNRCSILQSNLLLTTVPVWIFTVNSFLNVCQAIWWPGTSLFKAPSQEKDPQDRAEREQEVHFRFRDSRFKPPGTLWHLWMAVKCLCTYFFICKIGVIKSIHCEGSSETCIVTKVSKPRLSHPSSLCLLFLLPAVPLALSSHTVQCCIP